MRKIILWISTALISSLLIAGSTNGQVAFNEFTAPFYFEAFEPQVFEQEFIPEESNNEYDFLNETLYFGEPERLAEEYLEKEENIYLQDEHLLDEVYMEEKVQFMPVNSTPPEGDPFDLNSYQAGGNSQKGKQISVNANVDEFSGAASVSYPIALPPGRKGVAPKLSLSYHSQRTKHENISGYGWDLNLPQITRSSRKGVDEMYSLAEFNLNLGGNTVTLLPIKLTDAVHGSYGSEVENSFWRVNFNNSNNWQVEAKDGTIYYFGLSVGSRKDGDGKTYAWMLERTEDTNGNTVEYEYLKDSGQIYPKRIIYTNNKGKKDGLVEVRFQPFFDGPTANNIRPEKIFSYNSGFYSETKYRLDSIQTFVKGINNNLPVRTWNLNYKQSDNIVKRSLLASIVETGVYQDGSGIYKKITRPATTFNYEQGGRGWQSTAHNLPVQFSLSGAQYADLNGDGLVDAIRRGYNGSQGAIFINQGNNSWKQDTGWSMPKDFYSGSNKFAFFSDINGDGFSDLLIQPNIWAKKSGIFINNKNKSFVEDVSWKIPTAITQSNYIHVLDMNADGLADIYDESGSIYLNNGKGSWNKKGNLSTAPQGKPNGHLYITDINGDNLPDAIVGSHLRKSVFNINTGNGWKVMSVAMPAEFNGSRYLRILDVNNDGLADYGQSTKNGVNEIYLNVGNGFKKDSSLKFPLVFGFTNPIETDGDFSSDIGSYTNQIYKNKAAAVGLLSEIKNASGGKISFDYSYSSLPVSGQNLNPDISNRRIIKSVTRDNGLGIKSTTNYQFKDGSISLQSPHHKTFGGFHEVIKTEADGVITKTFYHQGGGIDGYNKGEFRDHFSKIGRPYRVEIWGPHSGYSGSRLFKKQVFHYNHKDLGSGRYFPYLEWTVESDYEGENIGRHRAQSYKYDNYGNHIEAIDYGEVDSDDAGNFLDIANDLVKTTTSYATPVGNLYLHSFASRQTIYDQNNKSLRDNKAIYDNLSFGQVNKGLSTKSEQYWDTKKKYLATSMTYDKYGNPQSQTNPRGFKTTISYDAQGYFPTKVINAKNQAASLEYNPVIGVVQKSTGLNGEISKAIYDSFGRLLNTSKSSRNGSKGTLIQSKIFEYKDTVFPSYIKTSTPTLITSPQLHEYFSYFDGFGNEIQTRTANKNGQFSVISKRYNNVFMVDKVLQPYFESGAAYKNASWTKQGTTTTYDALRRAKKITSPLGTTSLTFKPGQETILDAENNKKEYFYDIFDRLIKVAEHDTGKQYETSYEYSNLGELTKLRNTYWDERDFSYDSLGNLTSQSLLHSPGSTAKFYYYEYDENGNLSSTKDPNGLISKFKYDQLDRLISEDDTSKGGVEVLYEYDLAGNANSVGKLSRVTKQGGDQTSLHYDNLGQVSREIKKIAGKSFDSRYTYDDLGRLKEITYPTGEKSEYIYGKDLSLEKINYSNGQTKVAVLNNAVYNASGQIETINLGNGVETKYIYEPKWNNLLRSLKTTSGSKTIQNIEYSYDKVGNLKTLKESGSNSTARSVIYGYDDLYRLTSAEAKSSAGTTLYSRNFDYDPIGNIKRKNGGKLFYDQLRNAIPSAVTSSTLAGKNIDYGYDKNGNLTKSGAQSLKYDFKNRLTQVDEKQTNGSLKILASFRYDHNGERILKTNSIGKNTFYVRENYEEGADGKFQYIHAFDRKIARVELKSSSSPTLNFFHSDHLGSTSLLTDIAGNLIEEADYYPYGETRTEKLSSGTKVARHKFTGKEEDSETGLYYYGARYYSPDLGRFISVDPLQLRIHRTPAALKDPQALNEYAYARNNPLKYVDPTGEVFVLSSLGDTGSLYMKPTSFSTPSASDNARDIAGVQRQIGGFLNKVSNQSYATAASSDSYLDKAMLYPGGFITGIGADLSNSSADLYDPDKGATTKAGATFMIGLEVGTGGRGKAVRKVGGYSKKFLPQFSKSTIDEAVNWTLNPNKVNHIFSPKHELGEVMKFTGGKKETVEHLLNKMNGNLPSNGLFDKMVNINDNNINVRGIVDRGLPKIGTMFSKK